MRPNEYQIWTRSTAIYPKEIEKTYLVLGLMSEAVEVLQLMSFDVIQGDTGRWLPSSKNDLEKEAGDLCWYLARICDSFDITFDKPVAFAIDYLERTAVKSRNPKADVDCIVQYSGELCGITKKVLRDSQGEWQAEAIAKVLPLMHLILMNLCRVLHTYNSNLETVLQLNHAKLMDRKERGVLSGSGDNR